MTLETIVPNIKHNAHEYIFPEWVVKRYSAKQNIVIINYSLIKTVTTIVM